MAKNKQYTDQPRTPDKSFMDTVREIGAAFVGGMEGARRNSANPASEASRAQNRMEERQKKAYGGKAKMMCGGKAKKGKK